MQMVWHIVYGDQFLILGGDNSGYILLQFFIMLRLDQTLPALHGEYHMDVYLAVGIGHPQTMPLLTELENLFVLFSTNISPLTGLSNPSLILAAGFQLR